MTGTELARAHVGQIGLGAAGSAIARLMLAYGVGDMLVHDRSKQAMDWLESKGARPVDLAPSLTVGDPSCGVAAPILRGNPVSTPVRTEKRVVTEGGA